MSYKEAGLDLDDCLAKAKAGQPPGRPVEHLQQDLQAACWREIAVAQSTLMKGRADLIGGGCIPVDLIRARRTLCPGELR
jgi:hypothetical protein